MINPFVAGGIEYLKGVDNITVGRKIWEILKKCLRVRQIPILFKDAYFRFGSGT